MGHDPGVHVQAVVQWHEHDGHASKRGQDLEPDFSNIPDAVEFTSKTPQDIDGIYLLTAIWINERPVYQKEEDCENGGPFYFVFVDDFVWAVKEMPTSNTDDELCAISEQTSAHHPAQCLQWMTFIPDEGRLAHDPGVHVRAVPVVANFGEDNPFQC